MSYYELNVCGVTRNLPYVHIKEDLAYASFVMIGDTEIITASAKVLAEKIGAVDAIITAEAKGIALAYEVSKLLGLKEFIVARKSVKSYMKNIVASEELRSITTGSAQTLYLDGKEAEMIQGKRVCVIDDVFSTGESLRATENLAVRAGAEVVCRAAVLAEGAAADRDDIVFLQKLPLFTITPDGEYVPQD